MRKLTIAALIILLTACSSSTKTPAQTPTASNEGCTSSDFAYSVGETEGAAGTSYTTLIFENIGKQSCTLVGTPTAQPVGGESAKAIGPESTKNEVEGRGDQVVLKPGEKASVLYAVATASNYTPEECVAVDSDGVEVTLSGELLNLSHVFALRPYEVCTKLSSTFISGVVSGANG